MGNIRIRKNCKKEVNPMPANGEIVKDVFDQFQKVQAHMKNAREENAVKTYEGLKKDEPLYSNIC